jgi:MFS family permease
MYKKILYTPIVSLIFLSLGNAFLMTFITVKLEDIATPESIIGYIHAAFYAGLLLGALKSEAWINRVGHIRSYAAFCSLIISTILLQSLFFNAYSWILIRFFAGFATAALYVIIESWLLSQSTKKNKGHILAIYMVCLYSSQAASQFLLKIVDLKTMQAFTLGAILSSLSIIPSSLTYLKEPELQCEHSISILKYFQVSPLGFVGCVISGVIISCIHSFLPKYAVDNQLSVSLLLGITIFGGFCLQWPIGKLSDLFDRTKSITIIAGIILLPTVVILLAPAKHIVYFFAFILGGLCFAIYPISIALVCDYLKSNNIIKVTGTLLFFYGIGAVFSPPLIAFFIEHTSSEAIFYYLAINSIILLATGIYAILKAKPVDAEEQVEFVAMPRITPIAHKLDPRT